MMLGPNADPEISVNTLFCITLGYAQGETQPSRWNIVRFRYARVQFVLGMSISCCLSQFCLRFLVEYGL